MKKFLSLVLALVMTMSLVTISAGAKDFTDGDKVNYNEAIDVMSALKVIDGYTDGSFKPTTQLNRGQAAKILCNMILGPTTAGALKADAAPFKDVAADNTFAGYIAYCAKAGIIDGYTDGTFRPSAPLTGYAFMKLLLGALGYDKDVEGYNTPNWSINVAKQALGIGLDDGLTGEFDGTKIVTREEACLYAFNTLKATMVEYDAKTSVSVGGAEVVIAGSKAKDVEDKNDNNATIKDDEKMQFAEKYFPKLTTTGTTEDAFGRPSTEWKYKSTVIGNYVDKGALKETYTKKVTMATLYDLVGKSTVTALGKDEAVLDVYQNGIPVEDPDYSKYFAKNDSGTAGISGNGVVTEVYVQTAEVYGYTFDVVTIVQYNTWLFQAAENYSTKNESVKIKTTDSTSVALKSYELKGEDFDVEDVKKDDYLLITAVKTAKDSSIYEVKGVAVAETFEGEVTEYASGDSVKIGGEKKSYSKMAGAATTGTLYTVGETARVVLDKYGYIIGIDTALVSSNYVFIKEIDSTSGLNTKAVANAVFTDGTTEEITISKLYNGSAYVTNGGTIYTNRGTYDNTWYTYSKAADGKYVLHRVESKYIASTATSLTATNTATYTSNSSSTVKTVLVNGKIAFMGTPNSGTAAIGNDSTILVLKDSDGDYTTYTGIEKFPDLTFKYKDSDGSASGDTQDDVFVYYLLNKNTGYADYVFVDAEDADDASISDSENVALVYLVKKDSTGRTTDNKNFVDYKTWDPATGEAGTVRADADLSNVTVDGDGNAFGLYYKTRANSDSFLTNIQPVDNTAKYFNKTVNAAGTADTVTFSNGILRFNSTDKFRLTSDSQVVLVTRKGTNVNVDPSASYVATVTDGAGVEATLTSVKLNDYNVAGKRISDNSDVIETLYITVNKTTVNAPASSDASITSLKVKGVDATWNATTEQYEVLVPVAKNDSSTPRAAVVPAAGATATVKDSVNTEMTTLNSALSGDRTWTVTVTAANGTVKAYTLAVKLEVAPVMTTTATSTYVQVTDATVSGTTITPGTVKTPSGTKASDTVADLVATLRVADGYTISAVKNGALGGKVAAADTDKLNTTGLQIVVTCTATGTEFAYDRADITT
ncbi:S-layer homology domain-containing protein [Oscillibacter sp.]|uniref:S-layer homology domain-containing protein n=1 Tax=Oscillibacter sp. TaxID=1945593 RepID=UPI001B75F179|nr:S-layer homology domain-containing protein [Oscillibacter sp.]MBP3508546.1 S-layer homology domain-containing protein [Oscillibacter sp.]